MKQRIDWLNHSLEFIVVIAGILIAFQLNQCSNEKNQKKIINTHLQQITEETELNKMMLENSIEYTEANNKRIDTIFSLIKGGEDYITINRLSLELLNLGGCYLRKNAYLSLTESGDIRFLKDFEKKEKIIDLYEYYKWVEGFDEISSELYFTDYYPYLNKNFDLINGKVQSEKIYTNKLYLNNLGAYQKTNVSRVNKYKDCLKEVEKYLSKE